MQCSAHGRLQAQPALRRGRCCNRPGRGRERLAFDRWLSEALVQRRAHGSVASLGVRPYVLRRDVAQGVSCPSARAHEQEKPRALQVRQVRQMVQRTKHSSREECLETTVGHGQNSETGCTKLQCVVSHFWVHANLRSPSTSGWGVCATFEQCMASGVGATCTKPA